jgi:tetratricopeptide (TPR) repeat protein
MRRRSSKTGGEFLWAIVRSPKASHRFFQQPLYVHGLRQPQKAIALYREPLAQHPHAAAVAYALGVAQTAAGVPDEALASFAQAAAHAPRHPLPHQARGQLFAARRDWPKAVEAFTQAVTVEARYAPAYLARAAVYETMGQDEEAVADYQAAARLLPPTAAVWLKLGLLHERHGRWPEAARAYREAIRLDPRQAVAFNNLAWLAADRRIPVSLSEALTWATRAVTLAPTVALFHDTLGWVHWGRRATDPAVQALRQAIQLAPTDPAPRYHLGVVYAETNRSAEAKQLLHEALALNHPFAGAEDASAGWRRCDSDARFPRGKRGRLCDPTSVARQSARPHRTGLSAIAGSDLRPWSGPARRNGLSKLMVSSVPS